MSDHSFFGQRFAIVVPAEIIEKIRTLQRAISLEMVIIHMLDGGVSRAKAKKSLRLFAEKASPGVEREHDAAGPRVRMTA